MLVALNIHTTHASSTTSVTNGLVSSTSDVLRHSHPPTQCPKLAASTSSQPTVEFQRTSPVSEVEHTVPLARCVCTHERMCVYGRVQQCSRTVQRLIRSAISPRGETRLVVTDTAQSKSAKSSTFESTAGINCASNGGSVRLHGCLAGAAT